MYGRQTYINSIKRYCLLFNYASLLGEMGFVKVEYWKFRRFSSQNCELVWFLAIEAEADCIRLLRWEVSQLEEDLRYPRGPAVAWSWCHNCVLDKYRQHIVSKFCDAMMLCVCFHFDIFRHMSKCQIWTDAQGPQQLSSRAFGNVHGVLAALASQLHCEHLKRRSCWAWIACVDSTQIMTGTVSWCWRVAQNVKENLKNTNQSFKTCYFMLFSRHSESPHCTKPFQFQGLPRSPWWVSWNGSPRWTSWWRPGCEMDSRDSTWIVAFFMKTWRKG